MSETTPLKLLYQICTYTNCFPPYDFESLQLNSGNHHVLYLFLVTCLIVAQFVFSTYGRCVVLKLEFSMLIADTFANIAICACNIISCLLCYHVGNKFMNKLLLFHAKLDFESTETRSKQPENVPNGGENADGAKCYTQYKRENQRSLYKILFVHVIFITLVSLDIYVALYQFYDNAIYYYFFKYLQYYSITTLVLYTVFAMKQIKNLIAYVMSKLLHQMNSFLILPVAEMRESNKGLFTVTGWTKSALNVKASIEDVNSVVEASHKYKDIYLLCYYFNEIFGWPLLFVIGVVLFELIQGMNFVVQYGGEHEPNNVWMLCLIIFTAGYFYALQTWMILSCDDVTEEVSTFANIIYKQILIMSEVQDNLTEQYVLSELISLWYHVSNNKPKFHAGFIFLRKKFIYGSFIGIASFIAVIVEFNRVVYNHHGKRFDEE